MSDPLTPEGGLSMRRCTCGFTGTMAEVVHHVAEVGKTDRRYYADGGHAVDMRTSERTPRPFMPLRLACDFCSSPDPPYLEEARPFTFRLTSDLDGRSESDWASCARCHELITDRNWIDLEARAVARMRRLHPDVPRASVEAGVHAIHVRFRAHQA
jgi:hypothetical protein